MLKRILCSSSNPEWSMTNKQQRADKFTPEANLMSQIFLKPDQNGILSSTGYGL